MNTDNIFSRNHVLAYGFGNAMKSFIRAAMEFDEAMTKIKELDLPSSIEVCNQEEISFNSPESIGDIKKRIKYCKNPLELKQLNQKLNALYKEQKSRRT